VLIELDEKELEMINAWYQAAAGESASADNDEIGLLKPLLDKFGFALHSMDEDRCMKCGEYPQSESNTGFPYCHCSQSLPR
jgi:hypothetical protein